MLVSFCRWWNQEPNEANLIAALGHTPYGGEAFIPLYRSFLGWKGRAMVVRYEDIPRTWSTANLYKNSDQDRSTWNPEPSDWKKVWTPGVEGAFRTEGGHVALMEAGYPLPATATWLN